MRKHPTPLEPFGSRKTGDPHPLAPVVALVKAHAPGLRALATVGLLIATAVLSFWAGVAWMIWRLT